MLSTPRVLSKPSYVHFKGAPVLSKGPGLAVLHQDLERAKQRVGDFRVRHGDDAWKARAAQVDRKGPHFLAGEDKPVSRAYFKLAEILQTCPLSKFARTLHLCDAPGGFAQLVTRNPAVTEVIVTSRRCHGAPLFAASVLRDPKVTELQLLEGGDILIPAVRMQIAAEAHRCSFITADGAVDNDRQPEMTESVTAVLIACEISVALRCQVEGGDFILKTFGNSCAVTRECIALLAQCYETVSIIKPFTSRSTNDERYIVCENFVPSRVPEGLLQALDKLEVEPTSPFLTTLGLDVDQEWLKELDFLVFTMNEQQFRAIETALTSTFLSTESNKGRGPKQPGQKGGRGARRFQQGRGSRGRHMS